MNKRDQIRIVKELCERLKSSIVFAIAHGDIPENWDGLELREYLAELADRSRVNAMRSKRNPRKREYDNHVLVTGGL